MCQVENVCIYASIFKQYWVNNLQVFAKKQLPYGKGTGSHWKN